MISTTLQYLTEINIDYLLTLDYVDIINLSKTNNFFK